MPKATISGEDLYSAQCVKFRSEPESAGETESKMLAFCFKNHD